MEEVEGGGTEYVEDRSRGGAGTIDSMDEEGTKQTVEVALLLLDFPSVGWVVALFCGMCNDCSWLCAVVLACVGD